MKRRTFLLALVAVPLAVVVAPRPFWGLSLCDDGTHRRDYFSVRGTQRHLYARIRISAEAMEASRHAPPGSFLRYARAEQARCLREFADEIGRSVPNAVQV